MSRKIKNVAVLMGGASVEREVSLVSGQAVADALTKSGFTVTTIDVGRDLGALADALDPKPDAVFNALHGRFGEDGCVQGILNMLEIPYTHSGLMASALAMDKPMAKRLFEGVGIKVAPHRIATRAEVLAGDLMDRPYVIKPLNEGSSVGVHIIGIEDREPIADKSWPFGEHVMVEQFIPGRELTVAVMGDRPLCVTEIDTGHAFYDYDAKYADGGSSHTVPADLPEHITDEALRVSLLAHQTLGCRGVSRADLRLDGENLFMLEVNTQPGMTATSLVPEQAAQVGIEFEQLVSWMVNQAECDP
ncbi:MAG: D-alanine--D-alanine ligase [Rhodospirillaceae bacterium]|nr:D-alanine--D-alanine ligase [Rhodospirillaceae bacterium]